MRLLLSLALLLLLISCYSPERNCAHFKTGTFTYEALIGTEVITTTFTRNDIIEIDYFKGTVDTSSLRWINDCEYIVKKINPQSMSEKKAIHMKILTTDGDKYVFEYNIVGDTKKIKGTAEKIK
jgi:hypothetical protein